MTKINQMKRKIKFYVVDEERLLETQWLLELPFNEPIVFTEIKTGLGKRIGFKKYKKWWEFWK